MTSPLPPSSSPSQVRPLAALVVGALAACGGAGDGGARPDAAAPGPLPPEHARAVIVSGTFVVGEVGVMSELALEPLAVRERVAPNGVVANDPVLRRHGDELFVVNRGAGNNVTIVDAETFVVKAQLGTGAGANAQDVAVHGSQLFLPTFRGPGVLVLSREAGAAPTTIDLSALDPDGEPNCVSAVAVGDEIYVACELLDEQYLPRGPGQIAVIDAVTREVKTRFALASANPFGALERVPAGALAGDLLVTTVPSFADLSTSCIERIHTGPAPGAAGCLVDGAALGGYAGRLALAPRAGAEPLLWIVVNALAGGPRGSLRALDLGTLALAPVASPPAQLLVDAAACPDGRVVVADQAAGAAGLRVYAEGREETAAPLPIGLRPGSAHGLECYAASAAAAE